MCSFITSSIGAALRRFASVSSDGLDLGCATSNGPPRAEEAEVGGAAAFTTGEGVEERMLCEVEDDEDFSLEEDAVAASAFDRSDTTEAVLALFGLTRQSDGGCWARRFDPLLDAVQAVVESMCAALTGLAGALLDLEPEAALLLAEDADAELGETIVDFDLFMSFLKLILAESITSFRSSTGGFDDDPESVFVRAFDGECRRFVGVERPVMLLSICSV